MPELFVRSVLAHLLLAFILVGSVLCLMACFTLRQR